MRPLVLRVALWIALSILGSVFATFVLLRPDPGTFDDVIASQFASVGLAAARDDVAAASPDQRASVLAAWQARVSCPLAIVPSPRPDATKPWSERTSTGFGRFGMEIWLPLGGEALRAGPFAAPNGSPSLGPVAVAVLAIVLSTAFLVVWPISRRLVALEKASVALEAGNLNTRVDVVREDAIGRVARAFNTMASALERRMRDREELLQAVAHELGTPLARLALQLELLAERLGTPDDERIASIRSEITELGALTSELTSFVALEADVEKAERIDLVTLVNEAAIRVASPRLHLGPMPSQVLIEGDSAQVRRAIENVLRNGVQHARSEVTATVKVDEGFGRVLVDDDGPGVPESERERVFEPFARIDPARGRDAGGVGLGLAIVRRIVERRGGSARMSASPLGGARVVIAFPRVHDSEVLSPP